MNSELLALSTMWGAFICGLAALVAPWFALRISRWVATATAGGLASVGTTLALISNLYMPGKYNIRMDLVVNGFLMLVAWVEFVGLGLWAATAGEAAPYVKSVTRPSVTRPLAQAFTWSFLVYIGSFIGIIAYGTLGPTHEGIAPAEVLLLFLMVPAGFAWYITLGMIAHRLGRRWLVWTGLSFVTAPFGPLVVYPLMLSHIKPAHGAQSDTKAASS